ncbi:helix-turn-helix domain-containing protein [Hominenteromicrobium sp.]|uniref:helix-turn-helix domain-containing protein n=1 Tax=Hominenteromicrobium sp. TaxID=3073581 RepID=UPI003AEFA7C1
MENIDLNYICTTIGNLAGMPIRIFQNSAQIFYRSVVYLPKDPITAFRDEILAVDSHVSYFVTPYFHYYGILNSGEYKIIIGPTFQVKQSDQTLRELAFLCDVTKDETKEFLDGMHSILPMPLDSILQILCVVNYIVNNEKLTINDIAIHEKKQEKLTMTAESERAIFQFDRDINTAELPELHNTLALEQTILNFIRQGDTLRLREWIKDIPAVHGGTLAFDQIRQLKNTFIITAALASRAAIRGGMDIDDAFTLSDAYIQKCELMNTIEQITNLQCHMIFEYTQRVEKLRLVKVPSKFIADITNYVHHHLSEPISTEEMAKALFMNRSWMAVKFKQETNMTLTDFILKEKTEEAKRLLRYTDKPITSISAYLGFSSQSHFSRTFKKYTGSLPNEYRKRHNN